ncbi:MAG: sigma-70 family RNA polymerase sigma factor [Gemmatimonadaceae bacterium]|nr:sigma-70 family RNA polymerase sigma factor [Gemmatimonadaceae bacterium]MDQ3518976.1 sigma-70 family RNA polymerase sigma factor [Gemmatimonadota bacterium]
MSEDVAVLVRAARAGDRDAFGLLYHRYTSLVRAVLLAHALPDELPDLAQEVFLVALQRLHELREPAAFPGWLAAVTRNIARTHHRSMRRAVPLTDDIPSPLVPPDNAMDAERVLSAVKQLPENIREPLLLRFVEGMSGEEIARNLGMTHGAVRVSLHRGVKMVRETLEKRRV